MSHMVHAKIRFPPVPMRHSEAPGSLSARQLCGCGNDHSASLTKTGPVVQMEHTEEKVALKERY